MMNSVAAIRGSYDINSEIQQRHFSNPIFAAQNTVEPTIKVWLHDTNSTSKVVQFVRTISTRTTTSRQIDSEAVKKLTQKIYSFSELCENWDGYSGVSPSPSAIVDAINLVKMLPEKLLPKRAGVSGDGEISLFWERKDIFADFGMDGDGTYSYFIQYKQKKLYGDDIPLTSGISKEALEALNK